MTYLGSIQNDQTKHKNTWCLGFNISILLVGLLTPAFAQEEPSHHYVIVGGGNVADNSQGQIELNVNWIHDVIQDHAKQPILTTFYTDASGPIVDIKVWRTPNDKSNPYQPLARLYNAEYDNGYQFRNNELSLKPTASSKSAIIEEFRRAWKASRSTLIYNGHGEKGETSSQDSALMLWNDERLTVREFEKLLTEKPTDNEFRFVLTQCFSGAFAAIAKNQNGKVCGFMAESPHREAEGCSASIDTNDYRDYTTFFYAALDGRTRDGEALQQNPDRNLDGYTDFREAHLYTLGTALSNDLSRSTSEVFLEEWEPWYLRFASFLPTPDNEYSELSVEVAKGIKIDANQVLASTKKKHIELKSQYNTLQQERLQNYFQQEELKRILVSAVEFKWPQLHYPRTATYHQLIATSLTQINDWLFTHKNYLELVDLQKRDLSIEAELLLLERQLTQVDKIFRLRKLARLQGALERFGSEIAQQEYQQLLSCESSGRLE